MAASGTTQAAATGLSRRTKPEAENWDEDFDFVLPKRPARPAASSPSQPHELASEPSVPGAGAKPRPRRISSPIEDWDEELPEAGPSSRPLGEPMSASPEAKHREAYQPTSSVLESLSGLRLASPSGSQSHHGDHVMPTTNGSGGSRADKTPSTITVAWSRRELTDDPWSGEAAVPQSKTCHTSGTPSTEVSTSLPASTYPPDALLASPAKTIHHSKSREQMPPPSAPVSASASQRMSSRSSSRATLNEEATLAADGSADPDKKPGFWKRLSGNPGGPSMPSGEYPASDPHLRECLADDLFQVLAQLVTTGDDRLRSCQVGLQRRTFRRFRQSHRVCAPSAAHLRCLRDRRSPKARRQHRHRQGEIRTDQDWRLCRACSGEARVVCLESREDHPLHPSLRRPRLRLSHRADQVLGAGVAQRRLAVQLQHFLL